MALISTLKVVVAASAALPASLGELEVHLLLGERNRSLFLRAPVAGLASSEVVVGTGIAHPSTRLLLYNLFLCHFVGRQTYVPNVAFISCVN